jgi:hypothetical protein
MLLITNNPVLRPKKPLSVHAFPYGSREVSHCPFLTIQDSQTQLTARGGGDEKSRISLFLVRDGHGWGWLSFSGSRVDFVGRKDFKLDTDSETIERDPALSEEYRALLELEDRGKMSIVSLPA